MKIAHKLFLSFLIFVLFSFGFRAPNGFSPLTNLKLKNDAEIHSLDIESDIIPGDVIDAMESSKSFKIKNAD